MASTSKDAFGIMNTALLMACVNREPPSNTFRKGKTFVCTCSNISSAGLCLKTLQRNSFLFTSSLLPGTLNFPLKREVYFSPVKSASRTLFASRSSNRFIKMR